MLKRILLSLVCLLLISGCSCRARRGGENIPVAQEGSELKDVHFAFDSYGLDAQAKQILETNAAWLKANPSVKVQVEGHCDERGTNEYNMVLGSNRAKATVDYVRSQGVESSRMSTVSYGEELPLDPRHSEEAWAKNRRAHFNITNR